MDLKFVFAEVKAFSADGFLDAVASTGTFDRDNEIIEPEAWRKSLDRFRANPVILSAHQHRLPSGSSPVIGSAQEIGIRDGGLEFRMKFAGTPLGKEFEQLYREKHMRAFSVGFIPVKGEPRQVEGRASKVYVHTEVELLEISAVPVPANPEALARMRAAAAAGLDDEALARLADLVMERLKAPLAEAVQSAIRNPQSAIENVERQIAELIAKTGEVSDLLAALAPDTLGPDVGGAGGGTEGRAAAPAADPVPEAARRLAATLNP